jgi:flagellar motor switch protein FliG
MEGIEVEDPDLVEQIRRLMFVFEDILLVNDKGIQSVLKEVDNDELCLALKTASDAAQGEDLRQHVRSGRPSSSRRTWSTWVRCALADVEAAQQRIVDIVRRLEEAGEIIIAGRGGSGGDLIV